MKKTLLTTLGVIAIGIAGFSQDYNSIRDQIFNKIEKEKKFEFKSDSLYNLTRVVITGEFQEIGISIELKYDFNRDKQPDLSAVFKLDSAVQPLILNKLQSVFEEYLDKKKLAYIIRIDKEQDGNFELEYKDNDGDGYLETVKEYF